HRFTHNATLVWVGVSIWRVVNGVLDSTAKALVTEPVAPAARSVAFGWLALARGLAVLVAGVGLGEAYDQSTALVVWLVLGANAAALTALVSVLARLPRSTSPSSPSPPIPCSSRCCTRSRRASCRRGRSRPRLARFLDANATHAFCSARSPI